MIAPMWMLLMSYRSLPVCTSTMVFVFTWFCMLMLKEDFKVQVADSNCVKTIDESCKPEGKLTLATHSTLLHNQRQNTETVMWNF